MQEQPPQELVFEVTQEVDGGYTAEPVGKAPHRDRRRSGMIRLLPRGPQIARRRPPRMHETSVSQGFISLVGVGRPEDRRAVIGSRAGRAAHRRRILPQPVALGGLIPEAHCGPNDDHQHVTVPPDGLTA